MSPPPAEPTTIALGVRKGTAELVTADHEHVANVPLPAFVGALPRIVVWGSRLFVIEDPFTTHPAVYVEAVVWAVHDTTNCEPEGAAGGVA